MDAIKRENINKNNILKDKYIQEKVQQHYNEAIALGYNVVACFLRGAQNYGLDIYTQEYESDVDTVCLITPSFKNLIKITAPISIIHVRDNDEHIEIKDIRLYIDLIKKQNFAYIETLFTKYKVINPKYNLLINKLLAKREDLSRLDPKRFVDDIAGTINQKYINLDHITPHSQKVIEKYGYDPKELHHMVRLNLLLDDYIKNKTWESFIYIKNKVEKDYLINIKLGKIYNKKGAFDLAQTINNIAKTKAEQYKVEAPNKDYLIYFMENIIYRIIEQSVKEELLSN